MIVPMARKHDSDIDIAVGQRIAQNMQALLRSKGWTQGQLSYQAGVPQSNISALMVGRRNPSLQSVYKIATAFDVSIEELAGFKPLQIPEPVPQAVAEKDRLESLEKQVEVLSDLPNEVANLSKAIAQLLEGRSSARKRKQPGEDQRRSA